MQPDPALITSLRAALDAAPRDVPLRLHLAALLISAGRPTEAVAEAAIALQHDPSSERGRSLMREALGAAPGSEPPAGGFDWDSAESEVRDLVPPRFTEQPQRSGQPAGDEPGIEARSVYDVESSDVRLADVGGMTEVKNRINAAFIAPMANPELRRLYGKSLRGGLMLYGPPGCGKTFIARAIAGELDARFLAVALSDVLDMYIGNSEKNVHEIFSHARRAAPCVLFLDEVDAIGQRRSRASSAMRGTVNQLLTELDDIHGGNEGVFVLAATNHPWDVDPALRRPGRFDRTVLVLPPDPPAREAIFRYHLTSRPIVGIDVGTLARKTDGYSGADIAHLCETAAERALLDSVGAQTPRMIDQHDLEVAMSQLRPSTGPWFATAKNVAMFGNEDGSYDELLRYLKHHRLL